MQHPTVFVAAFCSLGAVASASAATPAGVAVEVANRSEPALCAENDNVTLTFASPDVRRFHIEAAHPVFIDGIRNDRWKPDWVSCEDVSPETSNVVPVRKVTFYEDVELWLTGYSFSNFWRGKDVPFRVGQRTEHGLHVVQLWVRRDERAEEALVVYPADGYWRIRPLPPAHLGWSAYGSSILLGPVEIQGRPHVDIKEIAFDPQTLTFRLSFDHGGGATIAVDKLDREHISLEVSFDEPIRQVPFAALRSMYVTEFNADVARIAAREEGARGWREEPIMRFDRARATDIWTGRLVPSRHNTSAPDIVFNRFRSEPPASR